MIGDPVLDTALHLGLSNSSADCTRGSLAASGVTVIRTLHLLASAESEKKHIFDNITVHQVWADAFISLTAVKPFLPAFNGDTTSQRASRMMGSALTLLVCLSFAMSRCHDCIDTSDAELLSWSFSQLRPFQKEIYYLVQATRTAYIQQGADPHVSLGVGTMRFAVAELVLQVADASTCRCCRLLTEGLPDSFLIYSPANRSDLVRPSSGRRLRSS